MEKELKIKLIEGLAKMDEGKAVKEILDEFIYEVGNVENIPNDILNGDEKILAIEVKGRKIAKKYLDILSKSLKPLYSKENKKQIIR